MASILKIQDGVIYLIGTWTKRSKATKEVSLDWDLNPGPTMAGAIITFNHSVKLILEVTISFINHRDFEPVTGTWAGTIISLNHLLTYQHLGAPYESVDF